MKKPFYIATAIAYTSGIPHIGNVYESILADAIARFKRKEGYDVYFQTGTDEHGEKIEQKALEQGKTTQEFVDELSGKIRSIYDGLNVSYDKFVRTTDKYHKEQVGKIYDKLLKQGDIYKGEYSGLYCVPCESFFLEKDLVNGKCPDCGREVKQNSEESYFLKLSNYQERLIKHINEHPEFIQPESRKNEMLNSFLKEKLPDLCVTRSSFKWGVPIPFDEKHVSYVWLDALSNYLTGIGYDVDGNHAEEFSKYWPCDVHLIGKDILRFHTIYWPIMLMALDLELPKQVFGHPWLMVGEGKMSKSKGNVIYSDDVARHFGVDAFRYYVLKEIPFAQDGTYQHSLMIERFNSDLVNTLANLVNRVISMAGKYNNFEIVNTGVNGEFDQELIDLALVTKGRIINSMDSLRVSDAIEHILELARRANKYIDETEPWVLGRDENNKDRLNQVLYNLIETVRFIGVLLEPFMPGTAEKIYSLIKADETSFDSLNRFGATKSGVILDKPEHLFARIEADKKLKEIETENGANNVLEQVVEEENFITIDDFSKIDLKAGKVLECKQHPDADRLLVSQIDTGDKVRQIVSGIAAYYKPEEFVGKSVLVVTNLKPVKLRGVLSEGMVLCGSNKDTLIAIQTNGLNPGDNIK